MGRQAETVSWVALAFLLIVLPSCENKGRYIPDPVDVTPPDRISSLEALSSADSSVTLRWLAAGDDPRSGVASKYEIRYQFREQVHPWWDSAHPLTEVPSQAAYAGLPETFTISGLIPMEMYYFRVRAADEVPNWSDVSNIAEVLVGPVDLSGHWSGYVWGIWGADPRQEDLDLDLYHWGPVRSLGGTYSLMGRSGEIHNGHIHGSEITLIIRYESLDRQLVFGGTVTGPEMGGGCSLRFISMDEIIDAGEWRVWLQE